jgi:predicted Fe-Mo cluster-binding NifX family protein
MVGGNAREALLAAGIDLYAYRDGGTVRDALDRFNKNTLERVA